MVDYYLGTTTSVGLEDVNKWFKGDIAEVKMWDRALSKNEVEHLVSKPTTENLILHYDFKDGVVNDKSGNENNGIAYNCENKKEELKIPYTIIPHRRPGRLRCLPHKDEGLVKIDGVDKWAKGETTARNERRYVLQMQQGKWDYKSDGIAQLKYDLVGIDEISPKAKLINVKL